MSEIKKRSDIEREEQDTSKEFDKEKKQQDALSKDAEIADQATNSLNARGTLEGKQSLEKASEALEKNVRKEKEKLEDSEKKIANEGEKVEQGLKNQSDKAKEDQKTANQSADRVKFDGAKSELKALADASRDDAQFLDNTVSDREKRRKQADQDLKQFSGHVATKKFKVGG